MKNTYEIEQRGPGFYVIDDVNEESMYLIVGSDKALLIDTGMAEEPIRPVLENLTDKSIELALTHAHLDHLYHFDEFDTVYLSELEKANWNTLHKWSLLMSGRGFGKKYKKIKVDSFQTILEQSIIELGNHSIKVLYAPGHTPGSCIFIDELNKVVVMGDAVGSGEGVWMWMPGCGLVSEYQKKLEDLLYKLKPYEDYTFLGGHRKQGIQSDKHPTASTLNIETVKDMYQLCEYIIEKRIKPIHTQKQFGLTIYEYAYGKASMWIRKNQMK